MFKHIVYIRHFIVVAAAAASLGLATATAPVAQARALDQQRVNNITAEKERPPTAGLKGLLAYLHKHAKFMGKTHAKAVGAVDAALELCGSGWDSLSPDQQAQLYGMAIAANQAVAGSLTAKVTLIVAIIRFVANAQQVGGGPRPATPTGLTVSPDPRNGTVMHLTWQDKANDEAAFEVDNTVERRDAPAPSGAGTFSYTWTGLKPGSKACFRVRASNYDTFSNWDPNTGYVCAYSSSPQPAPCTPKINAVGPFEATATQAVEITGSCFGTGNTTSGADTAYFRISDLTAGWNACWTSDPGTDQVTCDLSSWTSQKITFSGFTGDYGDGSWVITAGDHIEVQVWNPQSGKGPATYEVVAGSGSPNCC